MKTNSSEKADAPYSMWEHIMATSSFDMDFIICIEDVAENFMKAIEDAWRRESCVTDDPTEDYRLGEEFVNKGLRF